MVYVSSGGSVYGIPRKLPISEDHPTDPISVHGLSKLLVEKYLGIFHHLHGLEYQVARCSNPYGEWQNPDRGQGAVNTMLWLAIRGRPIHVWGDGTVVRDYVYAGDVADALVRLADHPDRAGVYNVGSGQGISINALIEQLFQVLGRRVPVVYEPARPFDVAENVLDISHIVQSLGWRPKVALPDGLKRTAAWLQRLSGAETRP